MKKWKIHVIHHSHTDIGYTDYQERILLYHYDFLRQALAILESGRYPKFTWQCENHWQIENFLKFANESEKQQLIKWVRNGRIGLSGNYLNMTMLADENCLSYQIAKARKWADECGVRSESAMTADINGYSWGFSDVLYENGYRNLYCALHTHHGMFPAHQCPACFRWRTPRGNEILMFSGEHYHLGNDLGLCPHALASYIIRDDFKSAIDRGLMMNGTKEENLKDEVTIATERLKRYLDSLEAMDYPFDCVPILVSGLGTDNAPPNAAVMSRIDVLGQALGSSVEIRMSTLDCFFDAIKASAVPVPVYSGDFTDWWAEGTGTAPNTVRLYREAQRMLRIADKMDPQHRLGNEELRKEALNQAALFAEHTWSYSSSASEPWARMVKAVELKHAAYAANAHTAASALLSSIRMRLGEAGIKPERLHRWRVINPHAYPLACPVTIDQNYWEHYDGLPFAAGQRYALRNCLTGEFLPTQTGPFARGIAYETVLSLDSGEEALLELAPFPVSASTVYHAPAFGAEGVADVELENDTVTPALVDTPFFRVRLRQNFGIVSIWDKTHGQELISDQTVPAFGGVCDITPASEADWAETRKLMGRNMVSFATERDTGKLTNAVIVQNGALSVVMRLDYRLHGTSAYSVYLHIYKTVPRISAEVRICKNSGLSPENVFVSLPFQTSGSNETYIDGAACVFRPGIDQLPGSCKNYYCVQNGLVRKGDKTDLLLSVPDSPLVTFALPQASPVALCDGHDENMNRALVWAWVINNFWETNFPANTGGDYEFRFDLILSDSAEPEAQLKKCACVNEGFQVLTVGKQEE